ncbi:E3 ubiquitin-protein ligase RING1-like protein [Morus notabilis]|uniref:RING-type E3 ubiquitin transferase n=1 Tax=Morus notabilis TaxID=981085 RepID=W9SN05_9ROSA|nr:E3 ubiquitin-protein ligase RING1-like protein [Morus notabilis]
MSSMSRTRSNPEINGQDYTYVFARNTYGPDDQTLPMPMFTIVFKVVQKYYPTGYVRSARTGFTDFDRTTEFERPLHRLWSRTESEFAILDMLWSLEIPFQWDSNLYWKSPRFRDGGVGEPRVPLTCVHNMVAMVSEVAGQMKCRAAETGRKKLRMIVTIKRRMFVPRMIYDLMIFRTRISESAGEDMRAVAADILMEARAAANVENPPAGLIGWKPAAKSAVDELGKGMFTGSYDPASKMMCSICMEEVKIGSHITRMPCSHMFHSDCIVEWLNKSHTCPLCRFSLPTD